jgi:hypothetical protein
MNAVSRAEQARLEVPTVSFELNGRPVRGRADEPLIEVARREGVDIPHLCYKPAWSLSATAAPASSRSTASACWRPRAAARRARA